MPAKPNTCETCKHWREFENEAYGMCHRIPAHGAWDADLASEISAYIPRDLDTPRLRVAPDFGCVLWEQHHDALRP